MSPALAVSVWAMMLSSVDLPAPDGPTMVRNSPSATENDRSWMTHGDGSRPWRGGKALAELADLEERGHGPLSITGSTGGRQRSSQRFQRVHQPGRGLHQQRRHQHGDEHAGGVEIHRAVLHQVAEPAVGEISSAITAAAMP